MPVTPGSAFLAHVSVTSIDVAVELVTVRLHSWSGESSNAPVASLAAVMQILRGSPGPMPSIVMTVSHSPSLTLGLAA